MFLILFVFLVSSAHNGTRNYKECKDENFKHGACWESNQLHKSSEFLKKI